MIQYKRSLFFIGVSIWGIIVALTVVLLFFPYQKAFRLAFRNIVSGGRVGISFVDVRIKALKVQASEVIVGHEALEGKPIFELEQATLTWNPLSIFKGAITVSSRASAYGGTVAFHVKDIPVVSNSTPKLTVGLSRIDLSKYPVGTLPWVKQMSGVMEGWIQKDLMPLSPEKQKGSFRFSLKDGELTEIYMKNMPRLIVPFRDVQIEGKIEGNMFLVNNILIRDANLLLKGNGWVQAGEADQKIDLKLNYEGISNNKTFFGKGVVTVVGNLWSPDIQIIPEGQQPVATKN